MFVVLIEEIFSLRQSAFGESFLFCSASEGFEKNIDIRRIINVFPLVLSLFVADW